MADAVAGLMDDIGWDTAHIAGNSLGGWTALELAKRGRARSVAAIGPGASGRRANSVSASRACALRTARLVWLRDCGHAPTWDDPPQVAQAILDAKSK